MAIKVKELSQNGAQAILQLDARGTVALVGDAERKRWNAKAEPATVLQFAENQSSNVTALQTLHQASGEPNVILKSGEKVYTLVRREAKTDAGYEYIFDGGAETEYVVRYIPSTKSYTLQTRALINNTNIAQNGSLPPSSTLVKQTLEVHTENADVHITAAERTRWNSMSTAGKDTFYGTCSTATSTATKTVNVGSGFTLSPGVMVTVLFQNAVTATSASTRSLNVNSTGPYSIQYNGSSSLDPDLIPGKMRALFVFDGSAWQLLNPTSQKGSATLALSFGTHFVGKTFTIAGSGFTGYSNVVPQGGEINVGTVTAGQTYTVTCNGYTRTFTPTNTSGVYQGYFNVLSLNSWSEIAQASSAGMASKYWKIGDTINITCDDGQILTLQIYDFLHDDLASGTGKAGITFGLKNLMSSYRQMDPSERNSGSFVDTCLYDWMRQDLWNMLPVDLRAVIKPVKKKTSAGSTSQTIRTDNVSLFLFSEIECIGALSASAPGEGTKYPIFTDNNSRKKFLSNGAECPSDWWTRSPAVANSSNYAFIRAYGGADTFRATGYHGVCFGFCV